MIPRFDHNDICQSTGNLVLIQNSPFHWKSVILIQRVMLLGVIMGVGALVGSSRPAIAREPVLDFGLTSLVAKQPVAKQPVAKQQSTGAGLSSSSPLAIPATGQNVPLGKADRGRAMLPPPPVSPSPPGAIAQPADSEQTDSRSDQSLSVADRAQHQAERREPKSVTLSFELSLSRQIASSSNTHHSQNSRSHLPISDLAALTPEFFEGGSASLLARIIGTAEGTRTPDGQYTSAYYGHVDPGNHAWNLGSFSYQHGASSPAEADERQLRRLEEQAQMLLNDAKDQHIRLTLEELLNGIDLTNQAPLAALGTEGYIDRLKQAQNMGLKGTDAILWARTRSFLDPHTQRWNAPGLGNTVDGISRDQERRQRAIAQTLMRLQPATPSDVTSSDGANDISNLPNGSGEAVDKASSNLGLDASVAGAERIIDQILSLDLPPDE
ncbi:MAG: hypothetical protein ACFE0I_06435 [Elainellaceae cyanobacterium]